MTDAPTPAPTGDLTVLDAWRLLVKPLLRPAASHVGDWSLSCAAQPERHRALVAALAPIRLWRWSPPPSHSLHSGPVAGVRAGAPATRSTPSSGWPWRSGSGCWCWCVGGLVLALLPVRFIPINVVGWTAIVTLAISAFAFRSGMRWRPPAVGSRADLIGAGLVVLLAASLRLPGLGYAEFQGDETEVILRATGVVQDLPDALFYHGKGPGEIVDSRAQLRAARDAQRGRRAAAVRAGRDRWGAGVLPRRAAPARVAGRARGRPADGRQRLLPGVLPDHASTRAWC